MGNCTSGKCKDFEKFYSILNLILDNEATPDQEKFFKVHVQNCMVCFSHYNIEKQLRELIKTKVNHRPISNDLASQIRDRIPRM